jgi:phosphoribosylcarboxyaminoimidazole (NCAIR) mutase
MAAHLAGCLQRMYIIPVISPHSFSSRTHADSLFRPFRCLRHTCCHYGDRQSRCKNAAILSAQIIGRKDPGSCKTTKAYRKKMTEEVEKKAEALKGRNTRK